jgi:hypothetical protein
MGMEHPLAKIYYVNKKIGSIYFTSGSLSILDVMN